MIMTSMIDRSTVAGILLQKVGHVLLRLWPAAAAKDLLNSAFEDHWNRDFEQLLRKKKKAQVRETPQKPPRETPNTLKDLLVLRSQLRDKKDRLVLHSHPREGGQVSANRTNTAAPAAPAATAAPAKSF